MPPKRGSRTSAKAEDSDSPPENKVKSQLQPLDQRRVLLVPDELTDSFHQGNLRLLRQPHPRTGSLILFLLHENRLFEITSHSTEEGFCSFLIDQSVEQDGKIYAVAPFDARFLVLEKLQQEDKFVELSDLFEGDLISVVQGIDVEAFADVKEVCERKLSRYNEEKAIEWLEKKVRSLSEALAAKSISCGANARSKVLVKKEETAGSAEEYLHSALDLICEYVNASTAEHLSKKLNIDRKRTLKEALPENDNSKVGNKKKRVKTEEPTENYATDIKPAPEKTPSKLTTAQKKLAKCDKTGMKSIASFFSNKKAAQ